MRRGWLAILLLFSGCSTMGPQPEPVDPGLAWEVHEQQLHTIDHWNLHGRLGVRTDHRADSLSLNWSRAMADHQINLFGIFGSGQTRITLNQHGAILEDAQQNKFTARTIAELLRQQGGWEVPFEPLQYWIIGLPAPGPRDQFELDSIGRLKRLVQSGWEITFIEYTQAGDLMLPKRLWIEALPGTVSLVDAEGRGLGDTLNFQVVVGQWRDTP